MPARSLNNTTAVIFDLDGTLVESAAAICAIANTMMKDLKLPALSVAETRQLIGNGAEVFLKRALTARDALQPEHFDTQFERFMTLYDTAPGDANAPFPGVHETLQDLSASGIAIGLCTNKPTAPTRSVITAMGWDNIFDTIITGDTVAQKKPHPAPLLEAANQLGREAVAYVGDSEIDSEAAAAAKFPFLLFTEGYRKTEITEITHTAAFSDFSHLPHLLQSVYAEA